ncbi:MAG: M20/M25/M40 family metallo-hydrolase [Gemmatimonadota bacterium]|nr:MAG: M20/M25/M40 family metallo-hydrolase [Gemmatimonadota bacterium]
MPKNAGLILRRIFACCFVSVMCVLTLAAQESRPYLVKVSRGDASSVSTLRDRGIPVHFKLEQWYIASAGQDDLERFEQQGIDYGVLDEEAWSQSYYLINRPDRKELGTMPDVGTVVFQDSVKAIVKIDRQGAVDLARSDFQLTRIYQKALPLLDDQERETVRLKERHRTEDVIGAIVNQVSQATIQSYVQRLQDYGTRLYASDSIWVASQWMYDLFIEFGYTDVVFDDFIIPEEEDDYYQPGYDVPVRNVVATKPGVLYPDVVIIIGGHYDSIVFDGTDPYVWAPGANDNASGTVGALEAARILADIDLDCTVKFACWTAEEIGLEGAWHYAENAYNRGENIVLYINYDMIANLDESDPVRDINIGRSSGAQTFGDLMVQMAHQYTSLVPSPYVTSGGGSDHAPFIQYDYDILYASEGDFSPHWHRATDVVENMDIPYFSEAVKMGLATLVSVAGPPESFPDPMIAFHDYEMDDDSEGGSVGNGNGYFDAGETIQVTLTLHNYGDTQADDVSGILSTNNTHVTLLDDVQTFGDIPSGETRESAGQFRFAISQNAPNGRYINFSVDATSSSGQSWTTYFSVRIEQPSFMYHTYGYDEIEGNGDGVLDAGETVDVYVLIENTGLRSTSGISVALESDDPDVTILDDQAVFPDMGVHVQADNRSDPFTFSLSRDAAPHAIEFAVHVSEGEGYFQTDIPFRILIGQGTVLLVVDDGGVDNSEYYTQALKHMGVMYDVRTMEARGKIVVDDLSEYDDVIWFTGAIGMETLTEEDQVTLADYLDGGGHLFLSGNLIGFDIGTTPFYHDYLHAKYVHFFTRLHHLKGVSSNPVVDNMPIMLAADGENLQSFTGETDPVPPAFSVFNYDRETDEGPGDIRSSGSGALAFENEQYKLVYCSFGFEGVEPFEQRVALLSKVLTWFRAPVMVRGDVNGDGLFNVLDVVFCVKISLELYDPSREEFTQSDVNYDGSVDVFDVMGIVYRSIHK